MSGSLPALPPGLRVYAIGDIHGGFDYLRDLLTRIEKDAVTAAGEVHTVFLGDYIDRGLHSRETLDFLVDRRAKEGKRATFLLGNHEWVMRTLLRADDPELLQNWFQFGGRETLLSYGINPASFGGNPAGIFAAMREKVPPAHVGFLDDLALSVSFGDYFFCHAGVRPGVALAEQSEEDLTWIRHEFLDSPESFGKIVVHGHTISHDVQFRPNRIGIDTGAYATGCLTALGLEGSKQWLLQTRKPA